MRPQKSIFVSQMGHLAELTPGSVITLLWQFGQEIWNPELAISGTGIIVTSPASEGFTRNPSAISSCEFSAFLLALLAILLILPFSPLPASSESTISTKSIVFHYHVGTSVYGSLPPNPSETLSRKTDECYHSEDQYGQCHPNE